MGIPNTIVKIIDKEKKVVDFDIYKIANAIQRAILDVESVSQWSAERRSQKYAVKIRNRIYREFYDADWLKYDFMKKFLSFKPEERLKRLDNAFITERLSVVFLENYRDIAGFGKISENPDKLKEYIISEIKKAKLDDKYTEGLFPLLSDKEREEVSEFLFGKVIDLSKDKLTDKMICPDREYILDTIEKELKDIGEIDLAEGFMIFREGKRKLRTGEISKLQFTNNGIHKDIVNKTLAWNIEHECETVFSLNDWVLGRHKKDIRELIELSEKRYLDDVLDSANKILNRKEDVKMIIIAGPSCSNKTTTTLIIQNELMKHGLKLKQINVDDYFKNLEDQPKDEFGDYDFEMPEAIDINLLNNHFEKLLNSETIKKPKYNFKIGKRDGFSEFNLEQDEILLVDCLHGLYKKLTAAVPDSKKFSIYIESMNIIRNITGAYVRWADVRMLKRMIRDVKYRGYSTTKTLGHWPYVRKGELKHIIPYIFSTDIVINAGLPFELPVLKKALENNFPEKSFIEKLLIDGRLDPYIRGIRTSTLLDTVAPFKNLDIISSTSPIREFIGGSSYIIPHNE